MTSKFDQDTKDRVVRLGEDRIVAEKCRCTPRARLYPDSRGFMAHGLSMDFGRPAVRENPRTCA